METAALTGQRQSELDPWISQQQQVYKYQLVFLMFVVQTLGIPTDICQFLSQCLVDSNVKRV